MNFVEAGQNHTDVQFECSAEKLQEGLSSGVDLSLASTYDVGSYSRFNRVGLFGGASGPHLDLDRAPYVLYGVKYIDLVSLAPFPGRDVYQR